jgi:hypothetical protein
VDVDTVEPIIAFVSSDEEGEDEEALMFLPVAPEMDEEEMWPAGEQQVSYPWILDPFWTNGRVVLTDTWKSVF